MHSGTYNYGLKCLDKDVNSENYLLEEESMADNDYTGIGKALVSF